MGDRDKVREDRLRRVARRQGLRLQRSMRRDPLALDFGTFQLTDWWTGEIAVSVLPEGYGLTLDEVEEWLTGTDGPPE